MVSGVVQRCLRIFMDHCKAHGCPCMASFKMLCRYHTDANPKDWPFVSEQLNKNVRLLKAIGWAMTDGRYRDNERVRETLTRLIGEYPELEPLPEDTAMTWAYRALAWLSRICRPMKHSEMAGQIRIAAIRQKYFPKTIEEIKEAISEKC